MHWADRSTRAFTAFLARTLRQERVCLILTYRADELHRRHPLRPLLSELERLERARRIQLEPFDRAELREALADILGAEPDGGAAGAAVHAQRGQPAVHRGAAGGRARRSRRGSAEPARRVPGAHRAVVGATPSAWRARSRWPAAPTSRCWPRSPASTATRSRTALRESVAEQVLVAGADGRFGFRHALLREALVRRPAARRARRAAHRAGARARAALRRRRRSRARARLGDRRPLRRRRGPAPRAARRHRRRARRPQGLRLRRGRRPHRARAGAVAARRRPRDRWPASITCAC